METHSSSCMSSYQWAEKQFFSAEQNGKHTLVNAAEDAPVGSNGVFFLPFLQGAACPSYDDSARGAYIGMSLASDKADMARATMEGICFENRMMLEALKESGLPMTRVLRIIGGASNSDFWNQIQADIYGLPVETITAKESAALGAAIICSVASGIYGSYREATENMTHIKKHYSPDENCVHAYNTVYNIWNQCCQGLSHGAFRDIYEYQLRSE